MSHALLWLLVIPGFFAVYYGLSLLSGLWHYKWDQYAKKRYLERGGYAPNWIDKDWKTAFEDGKETVVTFALIMFPVILLVALGIAFIMLLLGAGHA